MKAREAALRRRPPIRPDLTRELQAERKSTAAQLDTLVKRLGTTRDTAEPNDIEAQVRALVERQRIVARRLIEAETANPDEVDSRPELRERLAAANEELDARLSIIPRSGPRFAEKNDAKSRKSKQAFVGRPMNACLVHRGGSGDSRDSSAGVLVV